VEEMTMDMIAALAVEALAADRQFTVIEAYANQRKSRRSRNEQIMVRHQNKNNRKRRQEL